MTKGLGVRDYDSATVAKTKIEDEQRAIRTQRESEGHQFDGRFFAGSGEDFTFRSLKYLFFLTYVGSQRTDVIDMNEQQCVEI